jgi:hypothetical protein
MELAEEAFELVKNSGRAELIVGAIHNRGEASFWHGDVRRALEHFEKSMELIEKHPSIDYHSVYGFDLRVLAVLIPSIAATLAGSPERGLTWVRGLIEHARAAGDPFIQSSALVWGLGSIHWLRRDFAAVRGAIEIGTAQAVEYGFHEAEGVGRVLAALVKAAEGSPVTALTDFNVARADLESNGSYFLSRGFADMTAEMYRRAASETETLHFIDSCLEELSQSSVHLPEAELCRIKGEILGAASPSNSAEPEHWLRRAVETSHRQGARWYQLRATMSLAKLIARQDRRDEARTMLAEIYNWFTEGFDTDDLKDAKALLDDLGT